MNYYFIATNSAYNIITTGNSEQEAIQKANLFHLQEYGDTRDDWTAYELSGFLKEENEQGVLEVMTWCAWEQYLNQ